MFYFLRQQIIQPEPAMTKPLSIFLLSLCSLFLFTGLSEAGLKEKCECVGDYTPPRNTIKIFCWPVKTEWEQRYHCLPCGRKIPYKVKVVTYLDRYSDGTQRKWKCVVAGSEVTLGK
jgi:hypothetical protein